MRYSEIYDRLMHRPWQFTIVSQMKSQFLCSTYGYLINKIGTVPVLQPSTMSMYTCACDQI